MTTTDRRKACHRADDHRMPAAAIAPIALVALLALSAWALWYFGGPALVMHVTREHGPVELPTALLYVAAAAGLWVLRRPGDSLRSLMALSCTLIAFGARELDWHKAWTGTSVLKLSFYLDPAAPAQHKLVGGLAVLVAAAALLYLVARHAAPAWRGLRAREPVAVTIACFVLVLVVSKVLDRSVNVLAEDFQVVTSQSVHALVSSLEEILELGLPLLAVLGALQYRFGPRPATAGEQAFSYSRRGQRPTVRIEPGA